MLTEFTQYYTPLLAYLHARELNQLQFVSSTLRDRLNDEHLWYHALCAQGVRLSTRGSCATVEYAPNRRTTVDVALLPDRKYRRLCAICDHLTRPDENGGGDDEMPP